MLNIKEFRDKNRAFPDLLNLACIVDSASIRGEPCAIALQKDGSLMAGLRFSGPDLESMSHASIDRLSTTLNAALTRLGDGWATHVTAIRDHADGYIDPADNHFADPVSQLIDDERRQQFVREDAHFLSRYTLVLSWQTPPDSSVAAGQVFVESRNAPEKKSFESVIRKFVDLVEGVAGMLANRLKVSPLDGTALLTHIHECITGKPHRVNAPDFPVYLDVVIGHHEFVAGLEPKIDDTHIRVLTFLGYPQATQPEILEALHNLPFPLRYTTRFIYLDQKSAKKHIEAYKQHWLGARFSARDYLGAALDKGHLPAQNANGDASGMADDAQIAAAEASSGIVRYGFFTATVILMDRNLSALTERVRLTEAYLNNAGFVAFKESTNAVEAYLGSIPGHTWENVRKPLMHSMNYADLSPKTSVWPGDEKCPSPLMAVNGRKVPALTYAKTSGATPFRFNLHVSDKGHGLIAGPAGCHAKGHPILMADGTLKPVEDVLAGDRVMGPDGTPRNVLRLHSGLADMYRVTPVKGEPFVVNGDHILSLKRTCDEPTRAGEICHITVKDYLQKSRTFRHNHKLYRCGVAAFERKAETLPVSPYLLGLILGDGSCSRATGVLITNPDVEIAEALYQEAVGDGFSVTTRKPNSKNVPAFGITCGANAALRGLGCMRKTAGHKSVPEMYKTGNLHTRLELLAGLLDTDGSLGGKVFDYVSKSRQLADDVAFIARSAGLAAYVRAAYKSCQSFDEPRLYWRVCISGNTDKIPTRVLRKQAKPRVQKKDVLVTGFDVEPAGFGAYYGFELDGDHLYLDGFFTAHHNSGKSSLLALLAAQWLRYPRARVISFDKGRSMYALTEAVGGQHYDIAGELSDLTFAPLDRIAESSIERSFAENWLESLAVLQGLRITPVERDVIHRAVDGLAGEEGRSITDVQSLLQNADLKAAIGFYAGTGRAGTLLDARHDSLDLNSRFITFELENLLQSGESAKLVTVPTLLYLFHRIERMLDGSPTLIPLDEAWVMLDNEQFLAKIREWLKVLRKKNAVVVFATQSLADLKGSPLLPVITEECPTKILLPNGQAGSQNLRPMYEAFGLEDRQIELLQTSTPKRDYYIFSDAGHRRVSFDMGPVTLAFTGVSDPRDVKRVAELKANFGRRWPLEWLKERLPHNIQDGWVDYAGTKFDEFGL
ncbi:conjugal transfer protein TrbE [Acidithiobacillus ferrooxidans]|uniref:Hint domain-containing homing endonuclease n=1 Tax=Acidithiobacillus ferrooxidans TaxID=920 RepID=UPI001C06A730|nr:Hint domain-containing homing endonuclease [Acidithiobacillus ferrooxidans]MBU2862027.1 conjugal transfer protein TrbE [Acidithiobacillus ferrooxidans]